MDAFDFWDKPDSFANVHHEEALPDPVATRDFLRECDFELAPVDRVIVLARTRHECCDSFFVFRCSHTNLSKT